MASLPCAHLFTHAPAPKNSLWCKISNYTYVCRDVDSKVSSTLNPYLPPLNQKGQTSQCRAQFRYPANAPLSILKVLSYSRWFIHYCAGAMAGLVLQAFFYHILPSEFSLEIFARAGSHFWGGEMVLAVRSCWSFKWPPHLPDGCTSNWVVIRTGIYLISLTIFKSFLQY